MEKTPFEQLKELMSGIENYELLPVDRRYLNDALEIASGEIMPGARKKALVVLYRGHLNNVAEKHSYYASNPDSKEFILKATGLLKRID